MLILTEICVMREFSDEIRQSNLLVVRAENDFDKVFIILSSATCVNAYLFVVSR